MLEDLRNLRVVLASEVDRELIRIIEDSVSSNLTEIKAPTDSEVTKEILDDYLSGFYR